MPIYFYSAHDDPYGAFSNFADYGIKVDGVYWTTVEHYFQAQKFVGTEHVELIRKAKSPTIAARMGRSRQRPLRKDWESVKDDVMRKAVLCKFQQHAPLREMLLETGDEDIVENSPIDFYWGCGKDGSGKNMLGKILMEVREQLRQG
jgi:ribA/ribD-fused uncharacterized protein